MVFEGLKRFGLGRRDPFDVRGLEQFTEAQQERILNKISTREAEIMETKAEQLARKRIQQLEQQQGFGDKRTVKIGLVEKLSSIKKFREGNLKRQAERSKKFEDNEKAFREGRLAVKPVGPKRQDPTKTSKLNIKPINLRAPSKTLL